MQTNTKMSFISYILVHRFEMVQVSRNFMGPPGDWKTILTLTRVSDQYQLLMSITSSLGQTDRLTDW